MAESRSSRPPANSGGQSESRGGRVKRRRGHPILRAIFGTLGTLILIVIFTGSFLAAFAAVYIQNVILPGTDLDVTDYPMNLSSTIYSTNPGSGIVSEYETLHGDQNRVWVSYKELPDYLIKATVALEDRRFYKHQGVDWMSTARSVATFFTGGKIRGGSTITQQLIKNLTQYDDVTVKRKVQEIFTALEFDKKYDKKQTLEWYLNYIYFGRNCSGVYTASYKYFGKHVSELDLAECASLISITNNPSLYDPYTNPENNLTRRCQCLDWMYSEGYITQWERDRAKAEKIDFHQGSSSGNSNTVYSWYTEQVITDVINDLIDQRGYSDTVAHDLVYSGGLKIYACVDTEIQKIVEEIYSDENNLPYTSASGQHLQSAITIVDQSGNVVALSGKLGEKTSEDTRGWNRATRTTRQPGSTIKPLAVYAPALEMGYITPCSVMEDSPPFLEDNDPWPSNVDKRYLGQVTIDYALANSINTVAVRTLERVTPRVGFEYLTEKFGINPDHLVVRKEVNGEIKSDIGYSQLALGGLTNGLSTLDLAGAYSVFPRDGVYLRPRTYIKVEDSNGKVLLLNDIYGQPVLKQKTTYYMNQMLQHVVSDGGGEDAYFEDMTIAGKTGSTNANFDRWFVGYTPYYTAAVWVGYDLSERVKVTDSSNPAAKMWSLVMSRIHQGLSDPGFSEASGLKEIYYCKDSGKLATDLCRMDIRGSRAAVGYVYPEDVPPQCDIHTTLTVCTADSGSNGAYRLAGSYCPSAGVSESGLGKKKVSVPDLEREYVGGIIPEDNVYLRSSINSAGTCTVHGPPPVETPPVYESENPYNVYDPNDPNNPYNQYNPYSPYYNPHATPSTLPSSSSAPPSSSYSPFSPPSSSDPYSWTPEGPFSYPSGIFSTPSPPVFSQSPGQNIGSSVTETPALLTPPQVDIAPPPDISQFSNG